MARKAQLIEKARGLGLEVDEDMSNKLIQSKIDSVLEDGSEERPSSIFEDPDQEVSDVPVGSEENVDATDQLVTVDAPKKDSPKEKASVVPAPSNPVPEVGQMVETGEAAQKEARSIARVLDLAKFGRSATIKKLSEQEKISVFIPLEAHDPEGAVFHFKVNGVGIDVPKGEICSVPRDIARLWQSNSTQLAKSALRQRKIGANMGI